jgi:hypothetical protein
MSDKPPARKGPSTRFTEEPTTTVTARLCVGDFDRLCQLAKDQQLSLSAFVRQAVVERLRQS